jgi:hypothetical protein
MKIKAHQTFFIRTGWLYKGLSNVIMDTQKGNPSNLFISPDSMNRLGLGSGMVKSLRYWMYATGLTNEKISGGLRGQQETEFGSLVYKHDMHFQQIQTILLCHYFIATNEEDCTSWYYFFNEFPNTEFTKEDFFLSLSDWLHSKKSSIAESSILSDINCVIKTYYNLKDSSLDGNIFEDTKVSPLSSLGLITPSMDNKVFYKVAVNENEIPSNVAMYILLKQIENQVNNTYSINFDLLISQPCSIAKVYNLQTENLINLIIRLEKQEYLRYVKTAGLEQVIISDGTKKSNYYLEQCYEGNCDEK